MQVDPKFLKKIDSLIEVQQEQNVLISVENSNLKYSLCDRNDANDYGANYFISFQLPYLQSYFSTGSTMSKRYPELQQLNVDKIIVAQIPPNFYSELIDGRTVTMYLPQRGGSSQLAMSSVTLYSSTYTGDQVLKYESSPLLGGNIAFLFSDAINIPYTGNSTSDTGDLVDHSENTTWGYGLTPTQYLQKPSATSWKEVDLTYNTDTRVGKYSVPVPTNYPDGRAGYNYDVPVGFITLDEGFVVITHTGLTSNFPWESGYTSSNVAVTAPYSADTNYLKNIYFTGTTGADLRPLGPNIAEPASFIQFFDVNTSFKITAVCLALPTEFYISNNPTWNKDLAVVNINEQTGFVSFDPLYVTELGLYNRDNELVAVAKTSEPVQKDYTGVITFNVDVNF